MNDEDDDDVMKENESKKTEETDAKEKKDKEIDFVDEKLLLEQANTEKMRHLKQEISIIGQIFENGCYDPNLSKQTGKKLSYFELGAGKARLSLTLAHSFKIFKKTKFPSLGEQFGETKFYLLVCTHQFFPFF